MYRGEQKEILLNRTQARPGRAVKRGCMRASPLVGTGPSPILTKIAVVGGIDPKPAHEVLFRQVVSEIFQKTGQIGGFFEKPEKHISQFPDPQGGYRKKCQEQNL